MARHGINEGDLVTPNWGPDKNIYRVRSIFTVYSGTMLYINATGHNTTQQTGGPLSAFTKYDPSPNYNSEETFADL